MKSSSILSISTLILFSLFMSGCSAAALKGKIENNRYTGPENQFSVAVPDYTVTFDYTSKNPTDIQTRYYAAWDQNLPMPHSYSVFFSEHQGYPYAGFGEFSVHWAKVQRPPLTTEQFKAFIPAFANRLLTSPGEGSTVQYLSKGFTTKNNHPAYAFTATTKGPRGNCFWRVAFINYTDAIVIAANQFNLESQNDPLTRKNQKQQYEKFIRSIKKIS